MLALRLQAYTMLITSLSGCMALWDGLKQVKIALKLYPKDAQLLELKASLEDGFEARSQMLPKETRLEARASILKLGKLYQRQYPWLNEHLFTRSPELLRQVNETLKGGNCEVRRAFFGPNAVNDAKTVVEEDGDVGPLGVFATRDIQKGEMVMVDKSITGISNIPPSTLQNCDACHACLSYPFVKPERVCRPKCCKAVAFCSKLCHDTATNGYHKVLCGKEFGWVFKNIKFEGEFKLWRRWRAICFLRIMAIIIADNSKLEKGKQMHPLAHSLVSRMTTAYSSRGTLHPKTMSDWQLYEEITIPTKILMQLGIDIFASPEYSPEVIQTIYWRIENNANQSKTCLIKDQAPVHMVSINTNYLFFNHSCLANILWHGPPDGEVNIEFLRGIEGEMLRPGESAIWCFASRAIKKREECKISYIGDPLGDEGKEGQRRDVKRSLLGKWCENGCGCRICEKENAAEKIGQEDALMQVTSAAIGVGDDSEDSVEISEL